MPSSDLGTNPRSESVDSGVETASSDTSFLATSCSVSTDNAETDTFAPGGEGGGLTPASVPHSPFFSSPVLPSSSSSSPRICPSRTQERSSALHNKVEQALRRSECQRLKDNPEPLTADVVLRRRPRASILPKRHTSALVRGQRSQSFDLRRPVNSSVPMRQMSDMCRRPTSLSFDKQPAQTRSEVRYCSCHKPNCVQVSKNLAFYLSRYKHLFCV